ncbi:MAG: hypothetical protein V4623_02350 [Pseudomonadota bacterium]
MSLIKQRVLWANYPGEVLAKELLPCFPSLASTTYRLDQSEVRFLMTALSPLYSQMLETLANPVAAASGVEPEQCKIILRESVVLITYTLFDRMFRLAKILADENLEGLVVATQQGIYPTSNGQLSALTDGSPEFNQYLIVQLAASIWAIPEVRLASPMLNDVRNTKKTNNLNFAQPGLWQRVRRKWSKIISRQFGTFPTLRLANIDDPLLDGGLYAAGQLLWLEDLSHENDTQRDHALRNTLAEQLKAGFFSVLTDQILSRLGKLAPFVPARVAAIYSKLLSELIPPERLEGIAAYPKYEAKLASLSAPALFFCAMPGGQDIHWIAAAKKLRIPVVGVQHGAHYGFSSQPCFLDTEFAYCDKFVTWGWSDFPQHPLSSKIRAIALPSPWLSERASLWKQIQTLRQGQGQRQRRPHDVLLMSDRIQVFPPSVSTLRMSRVDFLPEINRTLQALVSELAQRKIRLLNKPFNYTSRDIQRQVLDGLLHEFPEHYAEYEKLDKGLTQNLLERAWLVLWDEPGTGFFECLVGGIPCMVCWERMTSCEEDYARPYFQKLEDVGLLHSSPTSLAKAIQCFLNEPEAWLNDRERNTVIRQVTDRFAQTDKAWNIAWKAALKTLASDGLIGP